MPGTAGGQSGSKREGWLLQDGSQRTHPPTHPGRCSVQHGLCPPPPCPSRPSGHAGDHWPAARTARAARACSVDPAPLALYAPLGTCPNPRLSGFPLHPRLPSPTTPTHLCEHRLGQVGAREVGVGQQRARQHAPVQVAAHKRAQPGCGGRCVRVRETQAQPVRATPPRQGVFSAKRVCTGSAGGRHVPMSKCTKLRHAEAFRV